MKAKRLCRQVSLVGLVMLCAGHRANAQTIYWTDIGTSKIQRAKLHGNGVEDLLTTGQVFTPVDIALDVAGGKIYWTEARTCSRAHAMVLLPEAERPVNHIVTPTASSDFHRSSRVIGNLHCLAPGLGICRKLSFV